MTKTTPKKRATKKKVVSKKKITKKKVIKKKVVKRTKKKKRVAKKKPYSVVFKIANDTYKADGKSVIECVENIGKKMPPLSCTSKGTFEFTYIDKKGKKHTHGKFLYARQLRKIFANEYNRIFMCKVINTGLGFDLAGNPLIGR